MLTALLAPVGMGYAEASGLPAIYGLYATIILLIANDIFGPSRILVLGPDSALTAGVRSVPTDGHVLEGLGVIRVEELFGQFDRSHHE